MSEEGAKRDWGRVRRRNPGQVNVRVSAAERAELERRAELASSSLAGYVKAAALGAPVPRRTSRPVNADRAAVLRLLAELGRLGSNANQIAKANNVLARAVATTATPDAQAASAAAVRGARELEAIGAELVALRGAIYDALGLR